MAITPGVDTWASVAEANGYLNNIVGASEWFALTIDGAPGTASREAYLVTAYYWLGSIYGVGADASAPDTLKLAQSLAALWLISHKDDYEQHDALIASGVQDFSWSQWQETLSGSVKPPRQIVDLMINLGVGGGNQSVQLYGENYDL